MEHFLLWCLLYLLLAVPLFFFHFCNSVDWNFRANPNGGFFSEGWRLLIHDYFGTFCPWSWKRARRYRLAYMRKYLGEIGRRHETLGYITALDCDNPIKQESIAREAFMSRLRFWLDGIANFLWAPIQTLLLVLICVVLLLALCLGFIGEASRFLFGFKRGH